MFERNYLVIYDIHSNKARRKVVKALENYGVRVQKSSFECDLNLASKKALVKDVGRLIEKDDSVRLYRMPDKTECVNKGVQYNITKKKSWVF